MAQVALNMDFVRSGLSVTVPGRRATRPRWITRIFHLRSAVRGPPAGAICIPARWHGTDPEVGFVLVDVGVGWALGVRDCPLSVPSPVGRPSAGAVSALDMVETFRPSALGFRRRKVGLRRATKSLREAAPAQSSTTLPPPFGWGTFWGQPVCKRWPAQECL